MKGRSLQYLYERTLNPATRFPSDCQIELTYRCNLSCVHCYCSGLEKKGIELGTGRLKALLDEIHGEGSLLLAFTGGEPLIREDFLDIYSYAKKKGFIIIIFSNGQLFNEEIAASLKRSPPFSIEVSLNGITEATYEKITQVKGSFKRVMDGIELLQKHGLPLVIKTTIMRQNKDEVAAIKKWVEKNIGKPGRKHYFKYDCFVYPRLNGDTAPLDLRLSLKEVREVLKLDRDMWDEHLLEIRRCPPAAGRGPEYLYHCQAWMHQALIDPYGNFKFCQFSDKFAFDINKIPCREGFLAMSEKIRNEKFKSRSKCRACDKRPFCFWCPSLAYLEKGDAEAAIEHYCDFAKGMSG